MTAPGAGVATNRFGDSYPIDAKGDPLPFSDEELASLREHEPPVGGMDDRFLRTIAALEQRLSDGEARFAWLDKMAARDEALTIECWRGGDGRTHMTVNIDAKPKWPRFEGNSSAECVAAAIEYERLVAAPEAPK